MSTKKKTKTKKTTTTTAAWTTYFAAALSGTARSAADSYDPVTGDVGITEEAATAVRLAQKMADIATARAT